MSCVHPPPRPESPTGTYLKGKQAAFSVEGGQSSNRPFKGALPARWEDRLEGGSRNQNPEGSLKKQALPRPGQLLGSAQNRYLPPEGHSAQDMGN